MSAFSTSPTRGELAATTSTARLITAITSSHSPSMLVNIALVSFGRPDARTTRTAAATAWATLPSSSEAAGLMLNATSMQRLSGRDHDLAEVGPGETCQRVRRLGERIRRRDRHGQPPGSDVGEQLRQLLLRRL